MKYVDSLPIRLPGLPKRTPLPTELQSTDDTLTELRECPFAKDRLDTVQYPQLTPARGFCADETSKAV